MKKFNEVSRECPSCKKSFPVEYMDEDGCKIAYPQNNLGLCPECYDKLLNMIRKEKTLF